MRCKKHLYDQSSIIGVCATCLRDRLETLIDKQSESPIQLHSIPPNPNLNRQQSEPPPLIFPRSVSPYISRRKSEPIQRFYSTPQVNITVNPPKKPGKFGFLSRFFRSKSSNLTSVSNSTVNSRNSTVIMCRNKGMSPDTEWEEETAESTPARWVTRPSPARVRPSPARAASIAFCLSPLVRASPARYWKGEKSGEINGKNNESGSGNNNSGNSKNNNNNKMDIYNTASFCKNRSRKLADFGRLNLNR